MAVISLLLGAMIGFTSGLAAFLFLGVGLLAAVGIWSLVGAGATVVLIGFALAPRANRRSVLVAENA